MGKDRLNIWDRQDYMLNELPNQDMAFHLTHE